MMLMFSNLTFTNSTVLTMFHSSLIDKASKYKLEDPRSNSGRRIHFSFFLSLFKFSMICFPLWVVETDFSDC